MNSNDVITPLSDGRLADALRYARLKLEVSRGSLYFFGNPVGERMAHEIQVQHDAGLVLNLEAEFRRRALPVPTDDDEADDDEAVYFQRINDRMDGDHETANDDYRDDDEK